MLDYHGVMRLANDFELYAAVVWLADHKSDYRQAIFAGFEPLPEEGREVSDG